MTMSYSPKDLRELLKERAKDLLTAIEMRKPDDEIVDVCEGINSLGVNLKWAQKCSANQEREYWQVA